VPSCVPFRARARSSRVYPRGRERNSEREARSTVRAHAFAGEPTLYQDRKYRGDRDVVRSGMPVVQDDGIRYLSRTSSTEMARGADGEASRDPVAVSYRLSLHTELRSRACTRGVCVSRRVASRVRYRASFCSVFRHARLGVSVGTLGVLAEYYFGIFPSGMSRDRNKRAEWRARLETGGGNFKHLARSFAFSCSLPKARRMLVRWAFGPRKGGPRGAFESACKNAGRKFVRPVDFSARRRTQKGRNAVRSRTHTYGRKERTRIRSSL